MFESSTRTHKCHTSDVTSITTSLGLYVQTSLRSKRKLNHRMYQSNLQVFKISIMQRSKWATYISRFYMMQQTVISTHLAEMLDVAIM